jgi:hypothetical protein
VTIHLAFATLRKTAWVTSLITDTNPMAVPYNLLINKAKSLERKHADSSFHPRCKR